MKTLVLLLLLVALMPAVAGAADDPADDPVLWPEAQRAFLQDGPGLLLSDAERAELLSLPAADEAGREAFILHFLDRDPVPATPANELREGIERRQRLAAREYASPLDVRAQLLFLRGTPAERRIVDCGAVFKPMEIWVYGVAPAPLRPLVVYRPGASEPYRLWLPLDSKRALYTEEMANLLDDLRRRGEEPGRGTRLDIKICPDARLVDRATGLVGLGGGPITGDGKTVARVTLEKVKVPDRDALGGFRWVRPEDRAWALERPADLAAWAREAAATPLADEPKSLELGAVDLDFPRREGQRMVARVLVPVPAGSLQASLQTGATEPQKPEVRVTVAAELERAGQVFEEFRVRYRLPEPQPGESLPLLFERQLRPDETFLLRLRVRDEVSGAEARLARGFVAPAEPATHLGEAARAAVLGELLAPEEQVGKNSIVLPPPPDEVVLNVWRADPLVNGDRIVKVVFLVDGKAQLSRTRAPFAAEVRLASFPKEQVVRVEGYDENGELVASDEVVLNRPRGTFKVTITEPAALSRAGRTAGRVTARAEAIVPQERHIESVEFRLNDVPVKSLTAPPWEAEVDIPAGEEIVYLSAVAKLDDGSQAEDTRFLRAPADMAEVDVHLVELYTAVSDGGGNLVQDLQASDFEVLEGGKPQALSKFELVKNLPLNVGLVIDTSTSMASSLGEAQHAATDFLAKVVTPRDRCFALGFAGRPYLLMAPTDDVEAVSQSIEGVRAMGSTALHDAVITALYYFRAGQGQRALVVLTDGDDTSSHTPFKQTLEFAQRSGVTVYAIGLGLSTLDIEARGKLSQLAEATGGRAFFVGKADELAGVYGRIQEELRSRYLLAYQTEKGEEGGFRPVEVRLKKHGLKARTARGYYP